MKTNQQIKREIFIIDQRLHADGLIIQYIYEDKDLEINLDIVDAALLLEKYGIVPQANVKGQVLVEYADEYYRWTDWIDFVSENSLTDSEALEIVCGEEMEKLIMPELDKFRSIPGIVKSILTPTKPAAI